MFFKKLFGLIKKSKKQEEPTIIESKRKTVGGYLKLMKMGGIKNSKIV